MSTDGPSTYVGTRVIVLLDYILKVNQNKPGGLDETQSRVITETAEEIVTSLKFTFNKSMQSGTTSFRRSLEKLSLSSRRVTRVYPGIIEYSSKRQYYE